MNNKPRAVNNYVDKEEFYGQLVAHKRKVQAALEQGKPIPPASDAIGLAIIKIAKGVASRYNFSKYSYRDEMVSDGILEATAAINKFDPDTSLNPFGYFSRVIWNSYLRTIDREDEQTYIRLKETEMASITGALVEGDNTEAFSGVMEDNDYRNDFISRFERKRADKKARREIRKQDRENEKELENNPLMGLFLYEEEETE